MSTPIYDRMWAQVESPRLSDQLWDASIDLRDDPTINAEAVVAASFGWLLRDWEQVSAA